jgi:hypothetical protein
VNVSTVSANQTYVDIFIGFMKELEAGFNGGEMIVKLILFLLYTTIAKVQSERILLAKIQNQELSTI